ncbi:ImmA/IrrE family metallo-endopeptidase [Vibrio mimicus]
MTIQQYSKIAPETLLKELELWSVPVDLYAICDKLNINTQTSAEWDKNHSGEIKVDDQRNVNIWINSFDAPNRQRFTLAHEIAHFINDILPDIETVGLNDKFEDGEKTLNRDGRQNPVEYRANDFAARLLMPKALVIKHGKSMLKHLKSTLGVEKVPLEKFVAALAAEFEVSEQAMEIRLRNIGIIRS